MATTARYTVSGMTCGHCVSAVTEELTALPGVRDVDVALVAGGVSTVTVTSDAPLDEPAVRAAVDEAGYELTGAQA
ncbi:Copper chaperone CopZ [Micromonospora pattaloongensis]|uniref:Copper chaperone CopZ n=1 Tax=Micromonospora pattaloongensis TaxID=405436 RepID=A0A1H3NNJ1_9ACTN|nr:heavy-metal-associated domain-containing protein [Micromonospora pattaloongensis]SDY90358.1 Copper chaperone CopZ [Micromonospora pattaloongensis]